MRTPIEKQVAEALLKKGLMLGTAESCTGGNIASLITAQPGSSAYFSGAVVSYNNEVKQYVLGVSAEDISMHGVVSRSVVEQMAVGAIRILGCDCAVATSGIAGPTGGSPENPVGTAWIAAAVEKTVVSSVYHFAGGRKEIIRQASEKALKMLLELLEQ